MRVFPMSKQVIWTKHTLEFFLEHSGMSDFQKQIMIDRCNFVTVVQMSAAYHCSESKIHKEISRIKIIYDEVQRQYPDELPVRKKSAKELYMDNH